MALRIITAEIFDKEGIRYWRCEWENGDGVGSLYFDDTYHERIAPRLREMWTVEDIYGLED